MTTPDVATFRGLGFIRFAGHFSQAGGISADGRVVVGQAQGGSGREACRWILPDGPTSLGPATFGPFGDFASAASDDGSVLAVMRQVSSQQAGGFTRFAGYRYSAATGLVPLGDLSGGIDSSTASDVSADGSVLIGQSFSAAGIESYRWTMPTGMQSLGDLPGGPLASNALAMSGDGSVIVGHGNSAQGIEGWRWTAATGMVGLGDFPGGTVESSAESISHNGQFIVGFGRTAEGLEAFRWTTASGLEPLGELSGGTFLSWAQVVSDAGDRIAGRSETAAGHTAFFWTPSLGMVPLAPFLRLFGATGLDGWNLLEVTGMTPDGRTLVGNGINPQGDNEGFIATLPASLECAAPECETCFDSDHDGFGDPDVPSNLCPADDCPHDFDPGQADGDHDGLGDACERCPLDPMNDADGDGFCAEADNCPVLFNPEQADADDDGRGDVCDNCPHAANATQDDADADGTGNVCDLCPAIADDQHDADGDSSGDVCDNCPDVSNSQQEDVNHDGAGDACQTAVRIDGFESSGNTLFLRAGAVDPQGEPIAGRLEIFEEPQETLVLADPDGDFSCGRGFQPGGVAGEGFGYAFASTGTPILFDLDSNLGCVDGTPDYQMAAGRCDQTSSGLTILSLSGLGPGDFVCVRSMSGTPSESELKIELVEPGLLRGRFTHGSRLVVAMPAVQPVTLPDSLESLTCEAGFLPTGSAGEGFGYAFLDGSAVLFDLDNLLHCIDGGTDYLLARGPCAQTSSGLASLDLPNLQAGEILCVRSAQGIAPESELRVDAPGPPVLEGRFTRGSRFIGPTAFVPGLPRQTDISSLHAGVHHRLVLTATDARTPAFSEEADFAPAGESVLVINRPPQAVATVRVPDCSGAAGTMAQLDGTASSDPDGVPGDEEEIGAWAWTLDPGRPGERPLGSGATLTASLPLGAHTVGLTVTDRFGERDTTVVAAQVNDTTPPTLSLSAVPNVLWPPNHKRVHVRVTWSASDGCDPAPAVTLVGVASSEPDDVPGPADGSTSGDIFDAAPGTADGDLYLRSERIDGGPGRTYTLTYRVTDAAGNQTTMTTTVKVPATRAGVDPTKTYRPDRTAVGTIASP